MITIKIDATNHEQADTFEMGDNDLSAVELALLMDYLAESKIVAKHTERAYMLHQFGNYLREHHE